MSILASPIKSSRCVDASRAGPTMFEMGAVVEIGLLVGMERSLNQSFPFWTRMSSEQFVMRAGVIGCAKILECIFMAQVEFECRRDSNRRHTKLRKTDDQWVFPQDAVIIKAMWIRGHK
eukprot:2482617-Karenia_brevis.AAC.1